LNRQAVRIANEIAAEGGALVAGQLASVVVVFLGAVKAFSNYADYQLKTDRLIPIFLLTRENGLDQTRADSPDQARADRSDRTQVK